MFNAQLQRLNRSMMDHLRSDQYCLMFEPFEISRKKLGGVREGDRIDLGENLPEIWVCRGREIVARARPGQREGKEGVLIRSAGSGRSWGTPSSGKRTVLEGRMALLPAETVRVGEWIDFAWPISQAVFLYAEGKALALARLIRQNEGYALEVTERFSEG